MNVTLKIRISDACRHWPRRSKWHQRKVLGMTPEQYRRRFKAAGLPVDENLGEPQHGPQAVRNVRKAVA
jgi:hypothetical protein